MKGTDDREALKAAIRLSHARYASEFADIPEEAMDLRPNGFPQTPAENLARRLGWMTVMISWERNERVGQEPLYQPRDAVRRDGTMNRLFEERYAGTDTREMLGSLETCVELICTVIDTMSDAELFEPHGRQWAEAAVKSRDWPVYRFFHANAVGGFDTARSKLRRWKRLYRESLDRRLECI